MGQKAKKRIAYSISIAAALIVVAFCASFLGKRLAVSLISGDNPNIEVSIESSRPCLPVGIRFSGLKISFRDTGKSLEIGAVEIWPRVSSLAGRLSLGLDAFLYGGRWQGVITSEEHFSLKGPFHTEFDLNGIAIGDCSLLRFGRPLTGKLSGNIVLDLIAGEMSRSAGRAELNLKVGTIPIPAQLGIDRLDFDRLDTELVLGEGTVRMSRCDLEGPGVKGVFQGDIDLDGAGLGKSRLAIRGDVTLPTGMGKRSIVFLGTLADPIVSML